MKACLTFQMSDLVVLKQHFDSSCQLLHGVVLVGHQSIQILLSTMKKVEQMKKKTFQ